MAAWSQDLTTHLRQELLLRREPFLFLRLGGHLHESKQSSGRKKERYRGDQLDRSTSRLMLALQKTC